MEVSLLEADGIPEGCLISVRAGSTRRQAPAEANKPCKLWFPRGFQSANPFKVDLLAPLGSTTLEVSPQADKYPIEVKQRYSGLPMRVTLRVREEANENSAGPELAFKNAPTAAAGSGQFGGIDAALVGSGHESPARRHQMAIDARSYLDEHNLLQWVQSLLQELIKDRPGDPWTYIDKQTAKMREKLGGEASKEAPPPVTELPKQMPTEPVKEIPKEAPPAQGGNRKVLNRGKSSANLPPVKIDDLRMRARKALEGEAERQKPPVDSIEKPKEAMLPFAGYYSKYFATAPALETMARSLFAKPAAQAVDAREAVGEALRAKACNALIKATCDGRLEAAISSLREKEQPVATTRPWIPHPCMFGGTMGMAGTMHGAHLFLASSSQAPADSMPSTELTHEVLAGSKILPVAATAGFAVGDPIYIESAAGSETNAIKGFGSISLMYPVKFTHPPGTSISKLRPEDPLVKSLPADFFVPAEQVEPSPESAPSTLNLATSTMTTSASVTDPEVHLTTQELTTTPAALDRVTPGQCLHSNAPSMVMSAAATPSAATAPAAVLPVESQRAATWMPHPLLLAGGGVGVALSMGATATPVTSQRLLSCIPSAAAAAEDKEAASEAPVTWEQAPSVGTWVGRLPKQYAPQVVPKEEPEEAGPNVEELQRRAKMALVKGMEQGNLMTILEEATARRVDVQPKKEEMSEEDLRERAQNLMMEGLRTGALSSHLEEVLSSKSAAKSKQVAPSDELRQQVKAALASAASDGRLASALRQEGEEAGRDALCTQAREVLLGACQDGRLAEALKRATAAEAMKDFPGYYSKHFATAPILEASVTASKFRRAPPVGEKKPEPAAQPPPVAAQPPPVNRDVPKAAEPAASASTATASQQKSAPPPPAGPHYSETAPPKPKAEPPHRQLSPPATSSVKATPRLNERLAPLHSAPTVGGDAEAELKLRQRTERFRQENEALRKENARLKKLREAGDAAGLLCSENDRLRAELGKLMTMNKKQHPLRNAGMGSSSCPKF
mmetsp:Transcript_109727/g.211068  ORF Transcript_109727/g.211068 Transcript_109727/m.211068 type:complete len:1018 (-) Transcript_109727:67-3120(-)